MTIPDYDTDFYTWTQTQAAALRAKSWAALDLEHLAEEIESLGRSERYAIESQLERLLLHLLRWCYDPAQRPRRGWRLTIEHARREIGKRATGALQAYPAQYLATAYRYARRDVTLQTGRPPATFPEICPWTVAQVLDEDFLPEA
jgi:Domain of unknown function DUF29